MLNGIAYFMPKVPHCCVRLPKTHVQQYIKKDFQKLSKIRFDNLKILIFILMSEKFVKTSEI